MQPAGLIDQAGRLQRIASSTVSRARERLAAAAARLDAGSPLHLLARCYSVSWLEWNPTALTSTVGLEPGATVVTQLADGRLWSRVERIATHPSNPEGPT